MLLLLAGLHIPDLDLQSDAFRAGMPQQRTSSGFLENNRAAFVAENDLTIAEILHQILVDILSNGSRYWDDNFFAPRRYGTIESRARCLQSASVANWVVKFVNYAISTSRDNLLLPSQTEGLTAKEERERLNSRLGFVGALTLTYVTFYRALRVLRISLVCPPNPLVAISPRTSLQLTIICVFRSRPSRPRDLRGEY